MKKSEICITCGLLMAMLITFFTDVNTQAAAIRHNTLRLHVIAQDNTDINQEIKLQVKDTVSGLCAELNCRAQNCEEAVKITTANLQLIQAAANRKLQQLGAGYTAKCSMEKFNFGTTEYDNFTMPRGEYTALTVRLGRAEGKNWWCVLYPGLCTSAGTQYSDDASNTFIETDNFRIKFKAVEIWQDIKSIFDSGETEDYKSV